MVDGDGGRPPLPADRSLGDIVREVSEKSSVLVREEIELAKAEVAQKGSRLARGAAAGAVAGVFAFFALIYLLHALAYFFQDLFDAPVWVGYLMVFGLLLLAGAAAGLLARRFFLRGTPPKPELAIEEAKKTRQALEEARG